MRRRKSRQRDYSHKHKKNIIDEASAKKTKVQPGAIVRFNYKGKDVHEPRPLVLVLNKNWKGYMHGLALRILSERELNKLKKIVVGKVSKKRSLLTKFKIRKKKVDIGDPQKFYKRELKRYLNKVTGVPYRTYSVKGISSLNVVDYKFES